MGSIRVSASGSSPHAIAQAKGKLFEQLMANVLRHHGYEIDHILNVNYSGIEIDIEGHATVTGIPLYAECKCYDTPVDSPKLQALGSSRSMTILFEADLFFIQRGCRPRLFTSIDDFSICVAPSERR